MADPIATIETDIAAVAAKVESILLTVDKDLIAALGVGQEVLPPLAKFLSAASVVMLAADPQAGGVVAMLATAVNAVALADKWAITLDGFLVHPSEATALNIATLANPSNAQKQVAAARMVRSVHQMKPELAANASAIAVVTAVAQLHHVDAPAAAPAAPTA